jgi:HK97 family phage prohead protease
MEKKYIKGIIEKATDAKTYSVLASTAAIDRQGDSIDQAGWDVSDYKKNPVVLWAHDYSLPPIAKGVNINPNDTRGLVLDFQFADTVFAQEIKTLVDGGFLSASSVGFMPMERNGNIITKSVLLEVSLVPVPANQEALMLAVKGFTDKGIAAEVVEKFLETLAKNDEAEPTVADDAEKGAVSDELDAEEEAEMKWDMLDGVFDIFNAFLDVYLDPQTPSATMPQLLLEVASLLTEYAQNPTDDDGDEQNEAQTAALRKLVRKSIGGAKGKEFLAKIGARHSAETTKSMQEAKDHMDQASAVLGALLDDASTEDGGDAGDEPEPADAGDKAVGGIGDARALLEIRGVLRDRTAGDQRVLSIINRTLAVRV